MKKQKKNRFSIDYYKDGGKKSEWISHKIGTLIGEGYPKDQAAAIAFSMYNKAHMQNGGIIFNQDPRTYGNEFAPTTMFKDMGYLPTAGDTGFTVSLGGNPYIQNMPTQYEDGGELPMYQNGSFFGNQSAIPSGAVDFSKLYPMSAQQVPPAVMPTQIGVLPSWDVMNKVNTPTTTTPPPTNQAPPAVTTTAAATQDLYPAPTFAKADVNDITLPETSAQDDVQSRINQDLQIIDGQSQMQEFNRNAPTYNKQAEAQKLFNTQQPFQFFNPYAGVDIPTAATYLGQSIEGGDTFGTVFGGLKLATGLGRNIAGGMGMQRRRDEALKNYFEDKRDKTVGDYNPMYEEQRIAGYYQEGGEVPQEAMPQEVPMQQEQMPTENPQQQQERMMQQIFAVLQQGADPTQVVQQLIQNGFPQEQAVQIVQQIMQQLQGGQEQPPTTEQAAQEQVPQEQQPMMREGGEYMSMLKGKKIKDYKFNPETNSYDVEFE